MHSLIIRALLQAHSRKIRRHPALGLRAYTNTGTQKQTRTGARAWPRLATPLQRCWGRQRSAIIHSDAPERTGSLLTEPVTVLLIVKSKVKSTPRRWPTVRCLLACPELTTDSIRTSATGRRNQRSGYGHQEFLEPSEVVRRAESAPEFQLRLAVESNGREQTAWVTTRKNSGEKAPSQTPLNRL